MRYWVSYANPRLPLGQQFLGVTIVEPTIDDERNALQSIKSIHKMLGNTDEPDIEDIQCQSAIECSHRLGINPGGEAQVYELVPDYKVSAADMHRLLSKAETDCVGG